jgi:hypothetical protein
MTIINSNFNNLHFRNTTITHLMTQTTLKCSVINMKIIHTMPYILSKKTKLNTLQELILVIIQYDIFYLYDTSQNLNSFTYNYIISFVTPFQLNIFESPPWWHEKPHTYDKEVQFVILLNLRYPNNTTGFSFSQTCHTKEVGLCRFQLKAALHLEAGAIHCVRGLKSSLVIGQKAQICHNPFTPRGRGDLVVGFLKLKNVCYDMARARWIGCTQNGGPILGLETKVIFH